jgi:hypothetical protein
LQKKVTVHFSQTSGDQTHEQCTYTGSMYKYSRLM